MRHGLTAWIIASLVPPVVVAQAPLVGTVRDAGSGKPIAGAEVVIESFGIRTSTDSAGRYRLVLPGGAYGLRARRVGYYSTGRWLQVVSPDTIRLDLLLAPAPQQLPEIEVAAAFRARLDRDIEGRRKSGFGYFVDNDVLRRSEHRLLSNVIQANAPGARIIRRRGYAWAIGRKHCPMAIWLDGMRLFAPTTGGLAGGPGGGPDLDEWHVSDIRAVEVYPGETDTPGEYTVTGSVCGTILLWTRLR